LAWGILRGGEFQWAQWQLLKMLRLPVVMLAFAALLPGPSIATTVTRIIVGSAMLKAVIAIAVSRAHPTAETMTSHQDSILFATAFCAVAVQLLERPGRRALLLNALIQPLLLYGMVVNDRRLVWVQLAIGLVVVFYSSSWSWVKFRLVRVVISAIPIALVYLAVGWHSPTGVFRPVGTLKSMADSDEDGSTKWRDLENYNLYKTLASSPLTGTGLGHPFLEVIKMPDVTSIYPLEPYVPHNNMLGHWAYNGYVGFSAWWMVLVVTAYYAHRAYRTARAPPDRIFALTTLATLTTYMLQVYGDVGMSAWHGVFTVATTSVITAKIAVANGALAEAPAHGDSARRAWVAPTGPALPPAKSSSRARQSRSA
jgi:O-antigen ligase